MTLPTKTSTLDVAAQCFLNSLVRETKDWRLTEYQPTQLIIPLGEQQALHFRVAYFSPTQHHRFEFPARLVTASGSHPIDFTTLSRLIVDKLQHQLAARDQLRNLPPARDGKPHPYAASD